MSALETGLRELIAAIVRDEVRRALAEATKPDEYLTTAEAGKVANVAAGTIRRWIREGRLDEHRAGRVVRVRRADLERLLGRGGRSATAGRAGSGALKRARVGVATPEELAARMFGDSR